MSASPHILLVEDDPEISNLVARFLKANDMRITTLASARDLDRTMADARIDLVVLDVMLPGEDGLAVCRRLRARSPVPIVMLTAKAEDVDRIIGLEMGADDYLGKPFNPRELLARIRAVLRRRPPSDAPGVADRRALLFEGWRLDVVSGKLDAPSGERVTLTGAEADLLRVFCEHAGKVLNRDQLLDLTRGRFAGPFDRSVDVLVSRLRQKIETDPRDPLLIRTIRGNGYVFSGAVSRE